MSEWNWYEQPVLRMPRFNQIPVSMKIEELSLELIIEEVIFKRELWCNPSEYEQNGMLKEFRWVKGIPGTRQMGLDWFFYVWRCQRCNVALIVGDPSGLKHGCTGHD